MDIIGLKHLVLYRLEQFIRVFVPCRHRIEVVISPETLDFLNVPAIYVGTTPKEKCHCYRCGKEFPLYITRKILPDGYTIPQ